MCHLFYLDSISGSLNASVQQGDVNVMVSDHGRISLSTEQGRSFCHNNLFNSKFNELHRLQLSRSACDKKYKGIHLSIIFIVAI